MVETARGPIIREVDDRRYCGVYPTGAGIGRLGVRSQGRPLYEARALSAKRKMEQQRPECRAKNKGQQPDGESAG